MLEDFSVYVDLSRLPSKWWQFVARDGRDILPVVVRENNTRYQPPFDLVEFDRSSKTGFMVVKINVYDTEDELRLYVGNPNARAPLADETRGQYNAYAEDVAAFYPTGRGNDRTRNLLHLTMDTGSTISSYTATGALPTEGSSVVGLSSAKYDIESILTDDPPSSFLIDITVAHQYHVLENPLPTTGGITISCFKRFIGFTADGSGYYPGTGLLSALTLADIEGSMLHVGLGLNEVPFTESTSDEGVQATQVTGYYGDDAVAVGIPIAFSSLDNFIENGDSINGFSHVAAKAACYNGEQLFVNGERGTSFGFEPYTPIAFDNIAFINIGGDWPLPGGSEDVNTISTSREIACIMIYSSLKSDEHIAYEASMLDQETFWGEWTIGYGA